MNESGIFYIEQLLEKHNRFEECVIESLSFKHFGTVFEVVLDYIWDDSGKNIRNNLNEPNLVYLQFAPVQKVILSNALNNAMLEHPEELTWGLNEISYLALEENSHNEYPGFHTMRFYWESDRYLKITFATLNVHY